MDENKKEGVTVREIGNFTKKHRFEVLFGLSFIFALFFSFVFFGTGWAVLFASIGAILGVLFPGKTEHVTRRMFQFYMKQEQTTQLVLGIVFLILSIFLPIMVFFLLGCHGGKSLYRQALETNTNPQK
jgi:hypothetical protein